MKFPIPHGKYIKKLQIDDAGISIDFERKKRVALVLIGLNPNYWPYLAQTIHDAKQKFLPHHTVDYFVWTDAPQKGDTSALSEVLGRLPTQAQVEAEVRAGQSLRHFSREIVQGAVEALWKHDNLVMTPMDSIEWPMPTLMRYHLFLQKEEELAAYDYIFYLDADMRIVEKISDEILGEDLTVALHPMYDLNPTYVPPYEPNSESTAFIPRLGQIIVENDKPRFRPLYLAGGFQGGKSKPFIKAMKEMKKNIDTDFSKNYIAIWNDESHWNKYIFTHRGPILEERVIVLGPEYIHPDSLIKEYYEPRWGRKLTPKIYTITKPFSLSKQGGAALSEIVGAPAPAQCPTCQDYLQEEGHRILRVIECTGKGKPHQVETQKI